MQNRFKIYRLLIVIFIYISLMCSCINLRNNDETKLSTTKNRSLNFAQTIKEIENCSKFIAKSKEAFIFCKSNNYSTHICFLINMSVHSGKFRFFVWDFTKNGFIDFGMVSHGCGSAPWGMDNTSENVVFSNTIDSHCSSLGKYSIGAKDYSQWGIHVKYFLHGLDSTNSNALDRCIILHSWDEITDRELYPSGTVEGWGCPAVSNVFMQQICKYIEFEKRPIILWIFN